MAKNDALLKEVVSFFKVNVETIKMQWIETMQARGLLMGMDVDQVKKEGERILNAYLECLETGDFTGAETYAKGYSKQAIQSGLGSQQIIMDMLTLKGILNRLTFDEYGKDPGKWLKVLEIWETASDTMFAFVPKAFVEAREKIVKQQQEALMELSTPVVRVWDKVLSAPLIGTLDSLRTQLVMETLLQRIVDTQSQVVILDISGIPGVDTLVANHLVRMVTAAKLLGAECIVTGVSSQIAQTLVHLGVDLSGITTRPSMSDGLAMAFETLNLKVVSK